MFALVLAGGVRGHLRQEFLSSDGKSFMGVANDRVWAAAERSVKTPMSSGGFGAVHVVEDRDEVIKFIAYEESDRGLRVQSEYRLAKKAADDGIGPAVYGYMRLNEGSEDAGRVRGAILMQRMNGNLAELLRKRRSEAIPAIDEQVPGLIDRMVKLGLSCVDLKAENMLYRYERGPKGHYARLYFTDFDAEFCDDEPEVDASLKRAAMALVLSEVIAYNNMTVHPPLRSYILRQVEKGVNPGEKLEVFVKRMGYVGEMAGKLLRHYLRLSRMKPLEVLTSGLRNVLNAPLLTRTIFASGIVNNAVALQGTQLVGADGDEIVFGSLETGKPLAGIDTDHVEPVSSIAIQGSRLVSGSWDSTVKVWKLKALEDRPGITPLQDDPITLLGHSDWVVSVAAGPGSLVVSGSDDKTLKVWDLDKAGEGATEPLHTLEGHTKGVTSVATHTDSGLAVSGGKDGTVRLWDIDAGKLLRTLQSHSGEVSSVAIDGLSVASGGDDNIVRVYTVDSRTNEVETRELKGHAKPVSCVAMRRPYVVSGSDDRTVKVWSARRGVILHNLKAHSEGIVGLAMDGYRVVSVGGEVNVWQLPVPKEKRKRVKEEETDGAKRARGNPT